MTTTATELQLTDGKHPHGSFVESPDPRIETWYRPNDLRAMLALVPDAPEAKLRVWASLCESVCSKRSPGICVHVNDVLRYWTRSAFDSYDVEMNEQLHRVSNKEASAWLRCIFAPPWLKGERCRFDTDSDGNYHKHPNGCPRIPWRPDPRWLSCTVLDLARTIKKGDKFITVPDGPHFKISKWNGPFYDRLPILADALQDAGCTCKEMLAHLMLPTVEHVLSHCWVLEALLGELR